MFTIHVYDHVGLPKENDLNSQVFSDLTLAIQKAKLYLEDNPLEIIDISEDNDSSPDPKFVWSSEHDR